jgi:fatty acid desaturase
MLARYTLPMLFVVGGYVAMYWSEFIYSSHTATAILSILWSWSYVGVCFYWIHDGCHGSFTQYPAVWDVMAESYDFLVGASHLNWYYWHGEQSGLPQMKYALTDPYLVLGHHPYTNIDGADPDISTQHADIRRIKPSQTWYGRYKLQMIYMPILYCLLSFKTRFTDFYHFYNIKINRLPRRQLAVFWGGKV